MHSQQKAAWFVLIVTGGTLVLYTAAVPVLSWWFHRTMLETAAPALGVFGLMGLTGFTPLFYRSRRNKAAGHELVMDERDLLLSQKAWRAGMTSFWLLFCMAGVGTWAYLYWAQGLERVLVPVGIFPGIIYAGWVIFLLTNSLATLHFYGWRASDAGR